MLKHDVPPDTVARPVGCHPCSVELVGGGHGRGTGGRSVDDQREQRPTDAAGSEVSFEIRVARAGDAAGQEGGDLVFAWAVHRSPRSLPQSAGVARGDMSTPRAYLTVNVEKDATCGDRRPLLHALADERHPTSCKDLRMPIRTVFFTRVARFFRSAGTAGSTPLYTNGSASRPALAALSMLAISACNTSPSHRSAPSGVGSTTTTNAPEAAPNANVEPRPAADPPSGPPDLRVSIGDDVDAPSLKIFAKLKEGMTPEEAGQAFPGAEQISKFGISDVAVDNVPGVEKCTFHFIEAARLGPGRRLTSADVLFKKSVSTPKLFEQLVAAMVKKYGAAKPEEVKAQLVTWAGRAGVAQLSNDPMGGGFMVRSPLARARRAGK